MLRFVVVLLAALPFTCAIAEEEKPPAPETPEQFAERVVAAFESGKRDTLKELAARDPPDPWTIAELLVLRGKLDAAEAYASAAPRYDTETLPAYVRSQRGVERDPKQREVPFAAAAEHRAGRADAALAMLEAARSDDATVAALTVESGRGYALRGLRRTRESLEAHLAAADGAGKLGWRAYEALNLRDLLETMDLAGMRPQSVPFAKRLIALETHRGNGAGLAKALTVLGGSLSRMERIDEAIATLRRAITAAKESGAKEAEGGAHTELGSVFERIGRPREAIASQEAALRLYRAIGSVFGVAAASNNLGMAYTHVGDSARALELYREALPAFRKLKHLYGEQAVLGNMGNAYAGMGRLAEAERATLETLALAERLDNAYTRSTALNALGVVRFDLGRYAEAMEDYTAALELRKSAGDLRGAAMTLRNIGILHHTLGRLDLAERALQESLVLSRQINSPIDVGASLSELGGLAHLRGAADEGIALLERALAIIEKTDEPHGLAAILNKLASAHGRKGDHERALAYERRSLALDERRGFLPGVLTSRIHVARLRWYLGRREEALALVEEVAREASAHHLVLQQFGARTLQTELYGEAKQWPDALRHGHAAIELFPEVFAGLSEESGASARALGLDVLTYALRATHELQDAAGAAHLMESGRAAGFLESLRVRSALQDALIPKPLRDLETEARADERRAVAALRRSKAQGSAERRAALKAVRSAQAQRQAVVSRIQRTQKAGASIAYPTADALDVLQGRLRPGQALVLYGRAHEMLVALVVRQEGARLVGLDRSQQLDAVLGGLSLEDTGVDNAAGVTRLRALLVAPLQLRPSDTTVLVSPVHRLGYVPFGMLFTGRNVVHVPSGTAYGVLREQKAERGRGVLAIGDPDYETTRVKAGVTRSARGGLLSELPPLPATRDEVKAIGTATLLGSEASETQFRKRVSAQTRWRAVHFACHGLVDPQRPMLSSLALSADAENDGYLSCLDLFRMKIPADLVVLSACETGKGKVYKSEGIVGLTRAFMFAGAPRVICSLWKVDDEATQALMIKFYDLWNPQAKPGDAERPKGDEVPERSRKAEGSERGGLGAAEALKRAQAFIRGHDKWKHPYYWAAWVLWGLPN